LSRELHLRSDLTAQLIMEQKLTKAICRNVFEMCGVIKAKAIVIIELDGGERLWAADGPLRDEFLNEGRVLNADDTEIELGLSDQKGDYSRSDWPLDEDLDAADDDVGLDEGPVVQNGSHSSARAVNIPPSHPVVAVAGQKRKTDGKAGKEAQSAQENAKKPRKDDEPPPEKKSASSSIAPTIAKGLLMKSAGLKAQMLWHGKNAIQWVKIAREARQNAIAANQKWHDDHPAILDPDWHILMYLRYRLLGKRFDQAVKTSTLGFWLNLKSRLICEGCLCFGAIVSIDQETAFAKRKPHRKSECQKECCGVVRCRVCGHAHSSETSCVCSCWVDSLKAALIIPAKDDSLAKASKLALANKSEVRKGKTSLPAPLTAPAADASAKPTSAPKISSASVAKEAAGKSDGPVVFRVPPASSSNADSASATLSATPAATSAAAKSAAQSEPKPATAKFAAQSEPKPATAKSAAQSEPKPATAKPSVKAAPKIVKTEMIEWRENELETTLHLVSDIIVREAKKDHQPLHDLSAHLSIWLDNAAAGRYSSFFSHILVNGFCQGCCCYVDEPVGSDDENDDEDVVIVEKSVNKHLMAECSDRCCGEFLCKICLHRHPIDGDCDCQCVVTALEALGLLEDDAEKVQESTKNRWQSIHKTKNARIIQKKVLDEISDW